MRIKTNNIYNMDCLEGLRKMPDKCVDLILTDAPYEIATKKGKETGILKNSEYIREIEPLCYGFDLTILDECVRVMKQMNAFFFCSRAQIPTYVEHFKKYDNIHLRLLTWSKTDPVPLSNGKWLSDTEYIIYAYEDSIVDKYPLITDHFITKRVRSKRGDITYHPTTKPVEILSTLLESASREGDIVIDPFLGSGSTVVACVEKLRNFIGFEISEQYFEASKERVRTAVYANPDFPRKEEYLEKEEVVSSIEDVQDESVDLAYIDVSEDYEYVPYDYIDSIIGKQHKPNLYITLNSNQILDATTRYARQGYKYDILTNHSQAETKFILFLRKGGVKMYGSTRTKHKYFEDGRDSAYNELPYELMYRIVVNSTCEGETVLLAGKYRTGINVCMRSNRKIIIIEPDSDKVQNCIDAIDGIKSAILDADLIQAS